jgi:hypothetical protein
VVTRIEGLDRALDELGDVVVKASLPKVGQPRSSHYEGEGWAIVRHPDTMGAVEALKKIITNTTIHYG